MSSEMFEIIIFLANVTSKNWNGTYILGLLLQFVFYFIESIFREIKFFFLKICSHTCIFLLPFVLCLCLGGVWLFWQVSFALQTRSEHKSWINSKKLFGVYFFCEMSIMFFFSNTTFFQKSYSWIKLILDDIKISI